MLRLQRLLAIILPVLLASALCGSCQTSDDGRPKTVQYNGQSYFVDQSPNGFALKITPQGTPVPIGIVNTKTGRINALDPSNYDTVKGVYDAYKASGSTFAAPQTPTLPASAAGTKLPGAQPAVPADRTVTFPPGGGAIVKDPDLKADVTFTADGTEASFTRTSQGPMGPVSQTFIAAFQGGDTPGSKAKSTGAFVKSASVAVLQADNTHVTSRIGSSSEVWKVSEKTNGGKESTLYETGGYTVASVYSPRVQNPGQSLAEPMLRSMKTDWEAIEKQAAAAKQAGQSVQVDFSGDRSQRAKAALDKAVPQ